MAGKYEASHSLALNRCCQTFSSGFITQISICCPHFPAAHTKSKRVTLFKQSGPQLLMYALNGVYGTLHLSCCLSAGCHCCTGGRMPNASPWSSLLWA